jgi:four helix bundle protein
MSERLKKYGDDVINTNGSPVEPSLVQEPKLVRTHFDLIVFQRAYAIANEIFRLSKSFPKEEMWSLTDQIRKSSRSTATCITEAWRRRRYPAAFINKLNEAEGEGAESQTWLQFALDCDYIDEETYRRLLLQYDEVLRMLVNMENHSGAWTMPHLRKEGK